MRPDRNGGARPRRGSIIVIVMVTLLFTAAALVAFLEKASNELLVASHVKVSNRLREDAYSALSVVLATLEDFRLADGNQLRSPTEGWGQALTLPWVQWTPANANHTFDVSFVDESGKLPVMHTSPTVMLALFEAWGLSQDDSQKMVDELLTWMHTVPSYVPVLATLPDYESDANPFEPPLRPIRSYQELASIDFVRDTLFDANGQPNDLFWKFVNDFSLFNYPTPNINGAPAEVLTALGLFNDAQQQNIASFLAGQGDFVDPTTVSNLHGQWFKNTNQIKNVVGGQGNVGKFGVNIEALRILITVHEGLSQYRLSVVVAPPSGAKTVQTTATDAQKNASNAANGEASTAATPAAATGGPKSTPTNAQSSAANSGNADLKYPFTILEITENDQILTPPPPPPTPPTT